MNSSAMIHGVAIFELSQIRTAIDARSKAPSAKAAVLAGLRVRGCTRSAQLESRRTLGSAAMAYFTQALGDLADGVAARWKAHLRGGRGDGLGDRAVDRLAACGLLERRRVGLRDAV